MQLEGDHGVPMGTHASPSGTPPLEKGTPSPLHIQSDGGDDLTSRLLCVSDMLPPSLDNAVGGAALLVVAGLLLWGVRSWLQEAWRREGRQVAAKNEQGIVSPFYWETPARPKRRSVDKSGRSPQSKSSRSPHSPVKSSKSPNNTKGNFNPGESRSEPTLTSGRSRPEEVPAGSRSQKEGLHRRPTHQRSNKEQAAGAGKPSVAVAPPEDGESLTAEQQPHTDKTRWRQKGMQQSSWHGERNKPVADDLRCARAASEDTGLRELRAKERLLPQQGSNSLPTHLRSPLEDFPLENFSHESSAEDHGEEEDSYGQDSIAEADGPQACVRPRRKAPRLLRPVQRGPLSPSSSTTNYTSDVRDLDTRRPSRARRDTWTHAHAPVDRGAERGCCE